MRGYGEGDLRSTASSLEVSVKLSGMYSLTEEGNEYKARTLSDIFSQGIHNLLGVCYHRLLLCTPGLGLF